VRASPGEGLNVPIWLLGSSDSSARLAATLGLPFAFASHFAPDYLHVALELYRTNFRPSDQLDRPHAMVGVNVIAADTDLEAARLFTSLQQQFLNLRRGAPGQFPPPVEDMDQIWSPAEKAMVDRGLGCSVVGGPETVRHGLAALLRRTGADELMMTSPIYDHPARLRSLELASQARGVAADE
jgi:luciferase family oxidoreductase group 1